MIRKCASCDSMDTYINKNGVPIWHNHNKDNNFLCQSCYDFYVNHPAYRPFRISFKGKDVYVNKRPRKGICKLCGKKIGDTYTDCYGKQKIIKFTHMHHNKYDKSDPIKHTKELCPSCHSELKGITKYIAEITIF